MAIVYQGVVADHAFSAAGRLAPGGRMGRGCGRPRRHVRRPSQRGLDGGRTHPTRPHSHVPYRPAHGADVPDHAALVTVIDGHPATLAWIGGVRGDRKVSLGVEHFGQTGCVADLYRYFGIDADGVTRAAKGVMER